MYYYCPPSAVALEWWDMAGKSFKSAYCTRNTSFFDTFRTFKWTTHSWTCSTQFTKQIHLWSSTMPASEAPIVNLRNVQNQWKFCGTTSKRWDREFIHSDFGIPCLIGKKDWYTIYLIVKKVCLIFSHSKSLFNNRRRVYLFCMQSPADPCRTSRSQTHVGPQSSTFEYTYYVDPCRPITSSADFRLFFTVKVICATPSKKAWFLVPNRLIFYIFNLSHFIEPSPYLRCVQQPW